MGARLETLTDKELNRLYEAAMEILRDVGVAFYDPEALKVFASHGAKVSNNTVFLEESLVAKALETAPSQFTITARDPEKSVRIGGENFVMVPAYGAPFMVTETGEEREANLEDSNNLCKLVHTSQTIDMTGLMMVQPSDVRPETAHLDMEFSNIVLSDKPFMGSAVSRQAALDAIEMAGIAWGGKDEIRNKPVMISLVSPLTPLRYTRESAGALIELARYGQPLLVADLVMGGSSGPITLAGMLALQSAEILAGITLAQLINPDVPVVYGGILSPLDMRTGGLSIGAPEVSIAIPATVQMARFYGLPARGGGALTDSHLPDMQAGAESALILATAARSGVNFILHACGILGSFMAMSLEKFVGDEEICGMVRRIVGGLDVSDETIDLETIKEVGIGEDYLTHSSTLERCRTEYFLTDLLNRRDYVEWELAGKKRLDDRAREAVTKRLATYKKPEIDPHVERALADYVGMMKNR